MLSMSLNECCHKNLKVVLHISGSHLGCFKKCLSNTPLNKDRFMLSCFMLNPGQAGWNSEWKVKQLHLPEQKTKKKSLQINLVPRQLLLLYYTEKYNKNTAFLTWDDLKLE